MTRVDIINPVIKGIDLKETLAIRHNVMWPNKPFDYIKLPYDQEGKHYGLSLNEELISIVSIFENDNKIQFRKLATLNEHQGKGYGTILIQYIIELSEKQQFNVLWCNARVEKVGFYLKLGFKETNDRFKKGCINYLIMEITKTSNLTTKQ